MRLPRTTSATALAATLALLASDLGAATCGAPNEAAETARGRVVHDQDGDGIASEGEPGIPGVAVSNGCEVTTTDADGRYELLLAPRQILFVSQPEGWEMAVDDAQLPRFHYRHYPEGSDRSVAWRYPVIEPTGPLPASIDFAIRAAPITDERYRAHAFADTQAGTDEAQDMLREDLVTPLVGNPWKVRFAITVGDVVNDELALYPRHQAMMGLIGVPQWNLPGNHDLNLEAPDAALATETYKRWYGPTYYSFDVGRVHFVALNNVEYAGAGNSRFDNGHYRGRISDDQLYWLARDLALVPRDTLIVIATHIPLITDAPDGDRRPEGRRSDSLNTVNLDRLLELLAPFENVYAMAGHDTSNSWKFLVDHEHGWHGRPFVAHTLAEARGNGWNRGPRDARGVRDAGMQDGNPNGYYVLHVDGTRLVPEFVPFPFGADAAQRMRIVLDPPLAGGIDRGRAAPGTRLVVNLFDGGSRDAVHASIDGQPFVELEHAVQVDPFVARRHERHAETDDAFGAPVPSSHVWSMPLPPLPAGLHVVRIQTEDEFGQRRSAHFTFELESAEVRNSIHQLDPVDVRTAPPTSAPAASKARRDPETR